MPHVIAYFLLSSLSLLGDSIFLYFVSLNLLQMPNGGVLCSIVLGLDAFFEIIVGPYLSRFIDIIPKLCLRLKRSLFLQIGMLLLAFLPALAAKLSGGLAGGGILILLLVVAIMRFFSLIDVQLKAALPLHLDRQGVMPLMQTLSLSVFSQRCIFLVSSAFAPLILGSSWLFACSLNALLYIPAVLGLVLVVKVVAPLPNLSEPNQSDQMPAYESAIDERKKWMNWNCAFQLLGNIAFSSVALILTKSMLSAKNESFLLQAISGPAPIYGGLLVSLVVMMFLHKKTDVVTKSAKRICWVLFCLGAGLLIAAVTKSTAQAVIFFVLGIINGFSLVSNDTFIQRKLEGKDFVTAIAKSQAFGKLGVLISLALAGIGIDSGFSTGQLIATCGFIGVVVSLFLLSQAFQLENGSRKAGLLKRDA
jgi:hypothetical protein